MFDSLQLPELPSLNDNVTGTFASGNTLTTHTGTVKNWNANTQVLSTTFENVELSVHSIMQLIIIRTAIQVEVFESMKYYKNNRFGIVTLFSIFGHCPAIQPS